MKKLLAILTILFSYGFAFNQTNVSIPQAGIYGGPTTGDDGIVGNLKGQYSVSPSGAMIYSLPIVTPPGAGGMSPTLSINYNSQAGNGLLGLGWNLSGVSAIIRTGKDNYHDGEIHGIDFSLDDKFVLDGSRLEVVSGTYGASGSSYKTEVESYSSITAIGSSTNGPESFIVKTKDGLTIEFGNTSDSRIEANISSPTGEVSKWLINKITNLDGYYIEFNYWENFTNGEVVLNNTIYSKNDNLSSLYAQYSIEFTYNFSRIDNSLHYRNGASFHSNAILTKIEIKHNEQTKYMYDFEYINSSFGPQFSYLKTIQLAASKFEKTVSGGGEYWDAIKANNGNIVFEHYNPLEINWTSEGTCTFGSAIYNTGDFCFADGYEYDSPYPRLIGDFNGDGKQDVLGVKDIEFKVALSTGNGFGSSQLWYSTPNLDSWSDFGTGPQANLNIPIAYITILVGDVNGDGMDDVVGFNMIRTIVLISNGSGFTQSQTMAQFSYDGDPVGFQWDQVKPRKFLADANGDGRVDIIGFGEDGVYVALSTGNTFAQHSKWTTAFDYGVNGWDNSEYIRTIADINGDGMVDLIGFGDQATSVYFSTGSSFVS